MPSIVADACFSGSFRLWLICLFRAPCYAGWQMAFGSRLLAPLRSVIPVI